MRQTEQFSQLFPAVDAIYQQYARQFHIPGYAFAILVDGKLIHSGSAGYLNLDKKTPVTKQSLFRIASMTKSFTAMAIMKLRDEGYLFLDTPVERYIPELNNQRLTQDSPAITIRHLLMHTAGFPQDDPWADRHLDMPYPQLQNLIKQGLSFSTPTGTAFEYSNFGYTFLGRIIEKVSGLPYQQYIREAIWQPLAMQQAGWEFDSIPPEHLAHGYRWLNGAWQEEPLLHDGCFGAMGGMLASIESFVPYIAFHQQAWPARDDEEIGPLKRSSLREMHQALSFNYLNPNYQLLDGKPCCMAAAYGYGLRWLKDGEGKTFVGHPGGLPGFGCNWLMMPDYGLGIVLLANVTYAPATDINLVILNKLINGLELKPRQLLCPSILQKRCKELFSLLPNWQNAELSPSFADNFFLDFPLDNLRQDTTSLFKKAGKIIEIGELIPENQLRGHFMIKAEEYDLKIYFTLSPEKPALIQYVQIKLLDKK